MANSTTLSSDDIPNMSTSTSMSFPFSPAFSSFFEMMPPPPTSSFDDHPKGPNFVGFTDLLGHGAVSDYNPSSFDWPQNTAATSPSVTTLPSPVSSNVPEVPNNNPASPNSSSISSSSNEAIGINKAIEIEDELENEDETTTDAASGKGEDQDQEKCKKQLKPKKKQQKKQIEPRFAFMTKSEVDQLEDGYRWRKYGQKAVKNSSHPRSYYRCTTASCGVKKRVERSSEDPTVVVTTYEGQHTHPCPTTSRASLGFMNSEPSGFGPISGVAAPHFMLSSQQFRDQHMLHPSSTMLYKPTSSSSPPLPLNVVYSTSCINYANRSSLSGLLLGQENQQGFVSSEAMSSLQRDNGLLQDIVPMQMRTEDNPDRV